MKIISMKEIIYLPLYIKKRQKNYKRNYKNVKNKIDY